MLIDTQAIITDYDGDPVIESRPNPDGTIETIPITARFLIWQALNTQSPNDTWDADERYRRFDLTLRTRQDTADLTESDREFIKTQSGKVNSPLAHGRLCQLLTEQPAQASLPAGQNGSAPAETTTNAP